MSLAVAGDDPIVQTTKYYGFTNCAEAPKLLDIVDWHSQLTSFDEVVERVPGKHRASLRLRIWKALAHQLPQVVLFPIELGFARQALGPSEHFALSPGGSQAFLGPFRDEVTLHLGEQSEQSNHDFRLYVLFAVELDTFLNGRESYLPLDQGVHQLNHLPQATAQARQLADEQAVPLSQIEQQPLDTLPVTNLPRGNLQFDEAVHGNLLFLGVIEYGEFLVVEVLRTGGDAEVGNGFQGCVQEKASIDLIVTDSNHINQPISW